jgi:tripartite ATP-independent transporter DctM subunit
MSIQPEAQLSKGVGGTNLLRQGYDGLVALIRTIMAVLLSAMSVLITYQVVARYVFNAPSSISEELLRYALIWMGILGSAYCFMLNRHLNLPLLVDAVSPRMADRLTVFNICLTLVFGALLAWGGYGSVIDNSLTLTPMLRVSIGALQSVLVISGGLIMLSQGVELIRMISRNPANAVNLIGVILVMGPIVWGVSVFRGTALYETWTDSHIELFSVIVLFGTLLVLLVSGAPIAIGLAFAGIFTLSLQIELAALFSTMGEKIFNGLDSFGFLALPFFVLSGAIMNEAGIARRLTDFAMLLGRRIPGNLWQTNVLANMLFGSISGSGIAAATAIGGVMMPIAREEKYDMAFSTAVNAASAPTGMLIPPSGALIVYSLLTGGSASVVALFLAGYVPGMIMGLAVMVVAYIYARRHNYPVDRSAYRLSDIIAAFLRAFPSLMLIAVVIGGIVAGIFTATEGSGIAVLYSLVLALAYRGLSWRGLNKVLVDTAIASGVIMFLIACSNMMSWSMTFASIPDTVAEMIMGLSNDKYVILLLINIILLVVGTFMDMAPAQLIFTPIFYPIVTQLGVDPVHFGVIMVYNLAMGVVTPPVGTVLFVSCSLTGEKITTVTRPLLPIFAVQIVGLLLVTYVPILSMALPRLFGF